jgi:outer membrane murein-binding lipoprotein Lpp
VTALVVFVILFVTTTILWIYESAERRNRDDRIADYEKDYANVVDKATIGGPEVQALLQSRDQNPQYSNMSAMQIALAQRGELAKAIAGRDAAQPQIVKTMGDAITRATQPDVTAANARVTKADPLANVVRNLADRLAQLQQERNDLAKQVEAAKGETQQAIAQRDKLLKQKDDQIAKVTQEMQGQMAQLATYRQQNEGTVNAIRESSNTTLGQAQAQNEQLTAQLNQANATVTQKQQQIDALSIKLKGIRVNPNEATIQKADGEIVRLPGNDLAHINLGVGDQIVQGMTFEVYDKNNGIPAMGADGTRPDEMPSGKASLEVVRIGPSHSEARIIRKEPGHPLVQGDLLVNLVYDKSQKYNFVVYGDFDIDNDGRTSAGDGEVIRRLITQWGGNVVNDVNVNTDFVVMGKEPVVDSAPPQDDAVAQAAHQRAVQELDRYLAVRTTAVSLNIPILNQNRFLNFVGYASQAAR